MPSPEMGGDEHESDESSE